MDLKNVKIRIALIEHDIKQCELARILGIHEQTLSRKLRDELPAAEQDKIVNLIRTHTERGGENHVELC